MPENQPIKRESIYFPGLNGLRFIAAFFVLIHHNEQIKQIFQMENFWDVPFIEVIGKLGVILFFVLSGFLITYLLLKEEEATGTIEVKKFYIRRMLRIWPLYYLLMGMGFFVFPYLALTQGPINYTALFSNYASNFIFFLFLMPNVAYILNSAIPFISQMWSVGVEEQFYFQWPLLMKKVKNKEVLLYSIIFFYLAVKFSGFALNKYVLGSSGLKTFLSFWQLFNIDCMAIGGLIAFYYFKKDEIKLKFLYHKFTQVFVISLLTILIALGIHIPYFHYEFYAILFGILILNLATNPNGILNLENRVLNFLGKISYGIYMLHPFAIFAGIKLLNMFAIDNFFVELVTVSLLTILIAYISYEFLEKYFIKRKIAYSKIISGDNVKQ